MGQKQKREKTEGATGLARITREQREKWNQMTLHGSQVLSTVPKKDLKRTRKGPSKLTQGHFLFHNGRRLLSCHLYWLCKLKRKWWSNSIIVACSCININWRLWVAYTFTTKTGMVSLDCNMVGALSASSSHTTIRVTAAKWQLLGAPTLKCCS